MVADPRQRLGGHGADAVPDGGHHRADGEELAGDGDAPGVTVAGGDREGHGRRRRGGRRRPRSVARRDAAGAAGWSATPARTSPAANDSISSRVSSHGGPWSRSAVVGQHELHGEQLTAGREQRAHAGDRLAAQGAGEGLHGEDLDDEVEGPHEVVGQVEQVGDPVVDLARRDASTAPAPPRTARGRRRRCGSRARRAARHPRPARPRRRPPAGRRRRRCGHVVDAPAGRPRCGPRACRPRRARPRTTAARTSGSARRRHSASSASRSASTSQSRDLHRPTVTTGPRALSGARAAPSPRCAGSAGTGRTPGRRPGAATASPRGRGPATSTLQLE